MLKMELDFKKMIEQRMADKLKKSKDSNNKRK
jgi:hypothetical protein